MHATKVSDLLPISDDDKHPHAYQVFGLEGGEQDHRKIKAAISATVKKLKEEKSGADPKAWKQAAKLVQQAEAILSDPQKRIELDAMFGVVHVAETSADPPNHASQDTATSDPLADILPSSDPLADVLPATNPVSNWAPVHPPADAIPIPLPESPSNIPASTAPHIGNNISIQDTTPRRRRRSNTNWFLVMLTVGLFAVVGILGFFVFFGPGELAITSQDGQLTIRKGARPAPDDLTRELPIGPPSKARDRREFDPVMPKTLANGMDVPPSNVAADDLASLGKPGDPNSGLPPELQKLLGEEPDAENPATTMSPTETTEIPETTEVPETPPKMTKPTDESTTTMSVEPPMESGPVEISDETVAATNQQIEQLRVLIRQSNWKQMTSAASDLKESVLTDEQRIEVESLDELADLATYYYGAIERGIASRQPAETIKVTDSLTIAIVEVGPDLLVIRYAGKNKKYKFDELPLILSHRMAEFALPTDKATNLAAKACYQAIAPKTNEDYRKESIDWLLSIDGEVPGAHPKQLAETIKQLFR